MNASRDRHRLAVARSSDKKMPSVKPAEEFGSCGGKRIRTQSGGWFRTEVTRGARLG